MGGLPAGPAQLGSEVLGVEPAGGGGNAGGLLAGPIS